MRSREKFTIDLQDNGAGKLWARMLNPKGEVILVPSFEDLFRVLIAIARCEEIKYGEFADGRSPRDLPLRFMQACAAAIKDAPALPLTLEEYEATWKRLAESNGLPVHAYRAPLTVVGAK